MPSAQFEPQPDSRAPPDSLSAEGSGSLPARAPGPGDLVELGREGAHGLLATRHPLEVGDREELVRHGEAEEPLQVEVQGGQRLAGAGVVDGQDHLRSCRPPSRRVPRPRRTRRSTGSGECSWAGCRAERSRRALRWRHGRLPARRPQPPPTRRCRRRQGGQPRARPGRSRRGLWPSAPSAGRRPRSSTETTAPGPARRDRAAGSSQSLPRSPLPDRAAGRSEHRQNEPAEPIASRR